MARALRNTAPQSARAAGAPRRRTGRDTTRRYLQRQLRDLDSQIEALIYAQVQEPWHILERVAWVQPAAAEVVWTGRLELDYLRAVREALVEALANL